MKVSENGMEYTYFAMLLFKGKTLHERWEKINIVE